MRNLLILFIVLFLLHSEVNSARILAWFFIPSISHQIVFQPIWKELSLRGHQVTVITSDPLNDSTLKNLTEIDMKISYEVWKEIDISNFRREIMTVSEIDSGFHKMFEKVIDITSRTEEIQEILRKPKNHFDLILIEAHSPILYGLQHKFKAPLIAVSSLGIGLYMTHLFGNSIHPALYGDILSGLYGKLTFMEKIENIYFTLGLYLSNKLIIYPNADRIARLYFGEDMPYIEEVIKNTSLLFTNVNPIFSAHRPLVPNSMEFSKVHLVLKNPIPKDVWEALVLSLLNSEVNCAKILAWFFIPSISHQIVFQPIWKELSLRGHDVTVVTPDPLKDQTLTNLTEIDVKFTYEVWKEIDISNARREVMTVSAMEYFFQKMHERMIEMAMQSGEVQEILRKPQNTFDLILIEGLSPVMYGLQYKFKAPLISISSLDNYNYLKYLLGNPINPALYSDFNTGLRGKLTLWEKIDNLQLILAHFFLNKFLIYPEADRKARSYFGNDMPYIEDVIQNTSLVFTNVNPVFSDSRPLVPNIMEFSNLYTRERDSISKVRFLALPKDVKWFNFLGGPLNTKSRIKRRNRQIKHYLICIVFRTTYQSFGLLTLKNCEFLQNYLTISKSLRDIRHNPKFDQSCHIDLQLHIIISLNLDVHEQ
ncbi:hypothetical protein HHI36_002725 [Cryptolaemus montrouzieri]|uniref:Uncharacterized protein n=1 Tax=Cryptolaemus montrouzieri TaxID=559131 RepID=A0ABD2PBB0_9CUCU